MTDKPIIFSAPMVLALLDGRKTQTRRVVKQQPVAREVRPLGFFGITNHFAFTLCDDGGANSTMTVPVGYQVGDRLWVRETHTITTDGRNAVYRVDATDTHGWRWSTITPGDPQREVRWRPSIHMPRWASRLTLTVTDVRVQRLQDISEADAFEEGCNYRNADGDLCHWGDHPSYSKMHFQDLWNSLHGPNAWDASPWVVALTFDVYRGNIDQIGGAA